MTFTREGRPRIFPVYPLLTAITILGILSPYLIPYPMGMRKKMRNKMKADWKVAKVTRDKNKLKRLKKAEAAKAA